MGASAIISLVIAVLTAIPSLVQAAEQLHDQSGAGPQKKLFVLDAIGKLIAVAKAADPKMGKILTPEAEQAIAAAAASSVDSAVTLLNAQAPAKPAA
jgi:hypothetical protein